MRSAQHTRRLDELQIVQQHERLQRRRGDVALRAVQTSRDIASNVAIAGGGERALPERVEAAAIERGAAVLGVGLAGAGLLPQARGLIRLDARAADAARQQAARGERAVANLLGEQPRLRAAREQQVVGIARDQIAVVARACEAR